MVILTPIIYCICTTCHTLYQVCMCVEHTYYQMYI